MVQREVGLAVLATASLAGVEFPSCSVALLGMRLRPVAKRPERLNHAGPHVRQLVLHARRNAGVHLPRNQAVTLHPTKRLCQDFRRGFRNGLLQCVGALRSRGKKMQQGYTPLSDSNSTASRDCSDRLFQLESSPIASPLSKRDARL
jgi:hypothetical protein